MGDKIFGQAPAFRADPAGEFAVKRYLDIREAAQYLGLSRWTLYKLVNNRRIPFIPMGLDGSGASKRNLVRFDVVEIDRWMKRRTISPLANGQIDRGGDHGAL